MILHTVQVKTKHIIEVTLQKTNITYIFLPENSLICFSSSNHATLRNKNKKVRLFDIFLALVWLCCLFVFTLTEQKTFEQKPEARQRDSDWASRSRDHATAI